MKDCSSGNGCLRFIDAVERSGAQFAASIRQNSAR